MNELGDNMLCGRSQSYEDKHLYEVPRGIRFVETEVGWCQPGSEDGGGVGSGLLLFSGIRISIWEDKTISEDGRR